MAKNKVYQIVQERFIKLIEEAINGDDKKLPWEKPWVGRPKVNYVTRRPYRGMNLFLLPEDENEFITFTQLSNLREKDPSIKLKKGCKKHMVFYWNIVEKENEDEETETIPILRYYTVYSINDVEGLESKFPTFNHEDSIEEANKLIEEYINNSRISFKEVDGSDRAFYSPSRDYIQVPAKSQFKDLEEFFSTSFHEIAHSTGHPSRLNRFKESESSIFGSENYSKEELTAEMTSAMILGVLGIENRKVEKNSVAYLYGWMKAIKEDINLIISACSKAQKASDFILSNIEEQEEVA
ncbi:ArdC family protein [Brassicibacter mesophilus]|uniref:ArdC family protein n=1 Tax=Brassicibacter mesophilus TaxID=745119 RepID=UPI003D20C43F